MLAKLAPSKRAFLATPSKKLTEEESKKEAAVEDRKKRVEILMQYQEKLDAIAKLEGEIYSAKLAAYQASPTMLGRNMASPNLGLEADGVHGLAERGGESLASTQRQLASWLQRQHPEESDLSAECRDYYEKYAQLEAHIRAVMEQNQILQETNQQLEHTIRQDRQNGHDRSDPYYEERQIRRPAQRQRRPLHAARGVAPQYSDYREREVPSPKFAVALAGENGHHISGHQENYYV